MRLEIREKKILLFLVPVTKQNSFDFKIANHINEKNTEKKWYILVREEEIKRVATGSMCSVGNEMHFNVAICTFVLGRTRYVT